MNLTIIGTGYVGLVTGAAPTKTRCTRLAATPTVCRQAHASQPLARGAYSSVFRIL